MSGKVLEFKSPLGLDEAWERYQALAREAADDPRKLADREFMERFARAEREWKALFNARDEKR